MDPHAPQPDGQQPVQQPPMQGHMPPSGQFNQPPQMQQPQENPGHTLSIVGLCLGIAGILLACAGALMLGFASIISIPLSIAGLICGIVGKGRTPEGMPSGVAIAGIIVGAVGIVIGIAIPIFAAIGLAAIATDPELQYLLDTLEALEGY